MLSTSTTPRRPRGAALGLPMATGLANGSLSSDGMSTPAEVPGFDTTP